MAKQSRSVFKAKQPLMGTCIGFAFCLVAVAVTHLRPLPFDMINWKLFDLMMQKQASSQLATEIVHVNVDNVAIATYGQWPWDRETSAKLVRKAPSDGC